MLELLDDALFTVALSHVAPFTVALLMFALF